ncbi:MAG: Mutator family transposase [candidate division NC10 bacterium]|nr:Mutator family transposase [candidate division NC10 bacterium]
MILDGAKGLRKVIQDVVGAQALVQRGQWHTREHGIRYVPQGQQAPCARGSSGSPTWENATQTQPMTLSRSTIRM